MLKVKAGVENTTNAGLKMAILFSLKHNQKVLELELHALLKIAIMQFTQTIFATNILSV